LSEQRVRRYIEQKRLNVEIRTLESNATRTSSLAAEALGCTVAEIAKSICFAQERSDTGIIVVLSGDRRVSVPKLEKLTKANLRKMNAEEVKIVTGYSIGGVPPFPHEEATVLADQSIFRFENVWAAAGASNAVMKIKPAILIDIGISKVDVSE
jgi:prolyl-tRNA editing enzyme YbaK/EbsC (Cys-tRNA(Pro) deacylase)